MVSRVIRSPEFLSCGVKELGEQAEQAKEQFQSWQRQTTEGGKRSLGRSEERPVGGPVNRRAHAACYPG